MNSRSKGTFRGIKKKPENRLGKGVKGGRRNLEPHGEYARKKKKKANTECGLREKYWRVHGSMGSQKGRRKKKKRYTKLPGCNSGRVGRERCIPSNGVSQQKRVTSPKQEKELRRKGKESP